MVIFFQIKMINAYLFFHNSHLIFFLILVFKSLFNSTCNNNSQDVDGEHNNDLNIYIKIQLLSCTYK